MTDDTLTAQGTAMSASPIDASVDALYDELFRLGKHRHDPVPMDPKAIIRKHLAAAALWELMQRSQPPVVQQPEARGVVDGWKLIIHTSERDNEPGVWAEKDGSRIWIAALTEARNVR